MSENLHQGNPREEQAHPDRNGSAQASNFPLHGSEEQYKKLFLTNPMPMWIYDYETKYFLEVNEAAIRHYGYSREDFLAMTIRDIRPPSYLEKLAQLEREQVGKLSVYRGQWIHQKKNGELIEVEITSHLIEFEQRTASLVLINDISEKVLAQHEKEFERKNKFALINNTNDLIWSIDADLKLIAANNAFLQRFKSIMGHEAVAGQPVLPDGMHEEGYSQFWKSLYARALSGEIFESEINLPQQDGEPNRWIGVRFHPIYDDFNQISGVACYSRDISTAKKSKEEMLAVNKRLETAQKLAKIGYWEISLDKKRTFWSSQVYSIWELDDSDQSLTYKRFLESVYEDDRPSFLNKMDEALQGRDSLEMEYRIITGKGHMKFIYQLGTYGKDENGQPYQLECTVQDITNSKKAEKAIRESEEKYRTIFNLSPMPQWIYSLGSHRILDVNQSAVDHYGYSREEFMKKTMMQLTALDDRDKLARVFHADLQHGTLQLGQWAQLKKDGSTIDVEIWGHRIDYNGLPALMVVANDVTERLRTELDLVEANQRLETAQQIARLGYWQHDFISGESYWSKEMYQIFDLERDSVKNGMESGLKRIPQHEHILFKNLPETAKKDGGLFEIQHHVIPLSGEPRIVIANGNFSYDEDGREVYVAGTVQDITQMKKIERALRSNEQQLEMIYNNVSDSIFLLEVTSEEEFIFTSVNNTLLETTGLTSSMVLHKNVKEVIPEPSLSMVLENYRRAIREGRTVNWEEATPYPTGIKYGIVTITPLFNEEGVCTRLLGSVHDVTDTKMAAAQLQRMNERFIYASRATSDAIWDWDLVTNALYWGDSYEKLTGFQIEENQGDISAWEINIHPEDKETVLESIFGVIQGDGHSWQQDYRYQHRDGHYIFISDRGIVLRDEAGKPYRMIGAMQDISHAKETERLLTSLNQRLEKRATELAESNTELERFAYIASHDLQEPLRMVSSFLQLLQSKYRNQLDDEANRYIHYAVDGANRMKTLILDLLEYSRLDTRSELEDSTDLSAVMEEVQQTLRSYTLEKPVEFRWSDLPEIRHSSRSQMFQLMQNLVVNAIKYNDKPLPVVEIKAEAQPKEWRISVKDNGIGIDPRYFDKVFIIFQRLHNRSDYSGTGIGLSICKKIVERHGGKIWIESVPGEGSTFYFTIPKKA